jgi:hypothetical protein
MAGRPTAESDAMFPLGNQAERFVEGGHTINAAQVHLELLSDFFQGPVGQVIIPILYVVQNAYESSPLPLMFTDDAFHHL